MTKKKADLSDLQLILLSVASQRDEGNLLPLPASAGSDKIRLSKAITDLIAGGHAAESPTEDHKHAWRETDDSRFVVTITETGRAAIGLGDVTVVAADSEVQPILPHANQPSDTIRAGSKQALLIKMLSRENGASTDELIAATGWLPHTTRAAISSLRKRGRDVMNERKDGISRYRMVAVSA